MITKIVFSDVEHFKLEITFLDTILSESYFILRLFDKHDLTHLITGSIVEGKVINIPDFPKNIPTKIKTLIYRRIRNYLPDL